MQDTARLFVAAQLPDDLINYLAQARKPYADANTRLVPEQNLHLTLFFIGNVAVAEAETIKQKLAEVAQHHPPFTLTLEQLEPGPKPRTPRLIWARFRQHQDFESLSRELNQALSTAPPEHGKFIPHVTLARYRKEVKVRLDHPIIQPAGEVLFPVSSIALWQSQLASPHPVYKVVEEFPLDNI